MENVDTAINIIDKISGLTLGGIFNIAIVLILIILGTIVLYHTGPLKILLSKFKKEETIPPKEINVKKTPILINSIDQIVYSSIEYGDDISSERRGLYSSQMRYVMGVFSSLRETIINNYKSKYNEKNTTIVETLLKEAFEVNIIDRFDVICRKDGLRKDSETDFVDNQRAMFVNGLGKRVINFLGRNVTSNKNMSDLSLSFMDENFINLIKKSYTTEIEDKAIEALKFCYNKAKSFYDTVEEKKRILYEKINTNVKICISNKEYEENNLDNHEWYKGEKIPTHLELEK